jgi:uncharacterized protein (DUF433 family)
MWYNSAMNPNPATTWKHLAPNPKSAYKQLFLNGRRIRARDLYGMFMSAEEPMTPAEIAADYDLPLEAVEEAIAYCQTDPPEIREDFAREERIMEATGMNDPAYKYGGKYRVLSPQERARLGI